MKLADKLVCLRKKQGLSQLKLAEIIAGTDFTDFIEATTPAFAGVVASI